MKKVLITGGAGFIGSHLTDHLLAHQYSVRILDNLHPQIHTQGKLPHYIPAAADFVQGDVTNRKDWEKALEDIDIVVHFAAAVGVGQSMYQVERYVRDNCLGTAILLDIIANTKHMVKKIIIAASMSSFGEGMYRCPKCSKIQQPALRNPSDMEKGVWEPQCDQCHVSLRAIPTGEDARLQSPSVYAITKKTQEELVLSIGKAYSVPAVSLRFFNAFGPRQSLSNPYNGVAAIFLSRIKNNKPPIINEDGKQTRDFVHIKDIVKAVRFAIEKPAANYQAFNIGSGIPITISRVAEVTLKLCNSPLVPEITGKFRNFDVRHCYADTTKLATLLDWKPEVSFEQGMAEVYEWSKNEQATDLVEQAMKELAQRGLR
jgi:dTDP-L-rhamnose 4-epimerase